ncbi:MAG TPA: hypothetical protein VEK55_06790 [Xanthobacteraceae bacterium]|nr:hypothetical protein [Xanthobacteraceae bacterium]
MLDLLKGLTGGGWAALYAWIFPSALAVGAFWLFVYPQIGVDVRTHFDALTGTEKTAVFFGVSVALGLALDAISTPLYRFLEGYAWPAALRNWGVSRHLATKKRLETAVSEGTGWQLGLKLERLARFPTEDDEVAPTQLGNALRSFETYGKTRFNLDSQTLWSELCAVAPKYIQDELDRSRASVDFFVALVYLSAGFAVVSCGIAIAEKFRPGLLAVAVVAFASILLWYKMAVVSSSYWSTTVQALVNVSREKLAEQLGLQIPGSIEAEREMWGALTQFVFFGDINKAKVLDSYRKSPATQNATLNPDTPTATEPLPSTQASVGEKPQSESQE